MVARILLSGAFFLVVPAFAWSGDVREWRFDVFLENTTIGSQVFRLTEDGARSHVQIDASFDVKVLFFTAYSYRHTNEEVWDGDCLASIRSATDDNGKPFKIGGERDTDGFVVDTGSGRDTLPACVRSFAYWNPSHQPSWPPADGGTATVTACSTGMASPSRSGPTIPRQALPAP